MHCFCACLLGPGGGGRPGSEAMAWQRQRVCLPACLHAAAAAVGGAQVLAERTGNAGWNPQLEQKVHAMQVRVRARPIFVTAHRERHTATLPPQLDGMTDETRSFVSRGADGEEGGPGVAVCAAAMQLVGEYGAQGAMVQVMHAAKKQLALELQELEASEGNIYPSGDLEGQVRVREPGGRLWLCRARGRPVDTVHAYHIHQRAWGGAVIAQPDKSWCHACQVEDPEWRDRVKDQMQLKELERQVTT
jgi:hypothetical protein